MKMKQWAVSISSIATLTSLLAGCGTAGNNTANATATGNTTTSTTGKSLKVGLITDIGGLNDHSFNQLSYEGLQKAEKDFGIQGSVVQSKSAADYVPALTKYGNDGYDLVVAVGFLMTDAVKQVAPQFPNTKFLILDVPMDGIPNATGAVFKTEQSAYLAGAMAGLMEQAQGIPKMNTQNVVGVVGGQQIPPVQEYIAGFQQGFAKTDPKGTLLIKWTNDFSDQALGNQVAKDEINNGADIVYQLAGGAGVGVIKAAKDAGVYSIGADADQSYLAQDSILTSTLKGVDTATYDVIKNLKDGKFTAGTQSFDLAGNGVGLTKLNSVVPQDIQNQVNQFADQIKNGTIQISSTMK